MQAEMGSKNIKPVQAEQGVSVRPASSETNAATSSDMLTAMALPSQIAGATVSLATNQYAASQAPPEIAPQVRQMSQQTSNVFGVPPSIARATEAIAPPPPVTAPPAVGQDSPFDLGKVFGDFFGWFKEKLGLGDDGDNRPNLPGVPGLPPRAGDGNLDIGRGGGQLQGLTAEDFKWLAYGISGEAGGGDDMYAVAASILNRYATGRYNSIEDIIKEPGQYEAYKKGTLRHMPDVAADFQSEKGQAKIVAALELLQGRGDFRGQDLLHNRVIAEDPMVDRSGNFYLYGWQGSGKNAVAPPGWTPPTAYRKFIKRSNRKVGDPEYLDLEAVKEASDVLDKILKRNNIPLPNTTPNQIRRSSPGPQSFNYINPSANGRQYSLNTIEQVSQVAMKKAPTANVIIAPVGGGEPTAGSTKPPDGDVIVGSSGNPLTGTGIFTEMVG
jgi:hypothetical protein